MEINSQLLFDFGTIDKVICQRCYRQFEWHHDLKNLQGYPLESLYAYQPFFQQRLYEFKTLSDVAIGAVFLHYHRHYLAIKYQGYTMVPAPSHSEEVKRRSFDHLDVIFSRVSLPLRHLFYKTMPIKQAHQPYHLRATIGDYIALRPDQKLPKKILLVDDVLTTGATILAMISKIQLLPSIQIKIFVLAQNFSEKKALHSS